MLQDAITSVRAAAKQALATLYDDVCTVYIFTPTENPDTGITESVETVIHEQVPCRLSFGTDTAVSDGEAPTVDRDATLFLVPDVDIPAGCKIRVTRNGVATDYARSGVPAVYATHQEIKLVLYEDYA